MTDLKAENKAAIDHFLAHHGVKGMRWGVRRDRSAGGGGSAGSGSKKKSGGSTSAAKPSSNTTSKAKEAVTTLRTKKPTHSQVAKAMSDEELKSLLSRMQMEKQYAQLMSEREQASQTAFTKFATNNGKALGTKINERLLNEGATAIAGLIVKGITKAATKAATKAVTK